MKRHFAKVYFSKLDSRVHFLCIFSKTTGQLVQNQVFKIQQEYC